MKKTIALLICMLVIATVTVQAEATDIKDDWCPGCGIWGWIKKIVHHLQEVDKRLSELENNPQVSVVQTGGGSGFDKRTLSESLIGHDKLFDQYDTYDEYLKEACVTPMEMEMMFRYWDEQACQYVYPVTVKNDCIMQHRADRTGVTHYLNGKEYVPK